MKTGAAFGSLALQGGGILTLVGACILASCASGTHAAGSSTGGDNGSGTSSGDNSSSGGLFGDGGNSSGSLVSPCNNQCSDFSSTPIIDTNTPTTAPNMFGSPTNGAQSGGPCLIEPQLSSGTTPGALFPNNWLRPRFVLGAPSGQTIFEIRLHNSIETNDLLVYTTATTWTMPKALWTALAAHVQDSPITVTVRGTTSSGPPALGSTGTFTIAPAPAGGSMVFWAAQGMDMNAMNTSLQGFHVGDETTEVALTTGQVQQTVLATPGGGQNLPNMPTQQVTCIGCHTATPDGNYAAFTAQWPWPIALASVQGTSVGQFPSWLPKAGAQFNLSPDNAGMYWNYTGANDVSPYMLGISTLSTAHYATGDRILITSEGSAWYTPPTTGNTSACTVSTGCPTGIVAQLEWFDLEETTAGVGSGPIPRTGDTTVNGQTCPGGGECSAGAPNWSHDGNNILYVSTDTGVEDGRMGHGNTDIKVVGYNNKQGGTVQAVSGASDPAYNEYYPAWSPDDNIIAFNRVAAPSGTFNGNMFIEPTAEVFVVPAQMNATATRLVANDPVSCTGAKSPGVQNSWPKWCPTSTAAGNGNTYYWLTFASKRNGTEAQLFVTGVVVGSNGTIETYPAIYLWNQNPMINNEIPAWDNFQIPPENVE
jgi:hypothetical protein